MDEGMHTPGPWIVVESDAAIIERPAAWICTLGNNPDDPAVFSTAMDGNKFIFGDKLADACLIAAAPELLEALKAMLRHSCVADAHPEDKDDEDHVAERMAYAAIAKAVPA